MVLVMVMELVLVYLCTCVPVYLCTMMHHKLWYYILSSVQLNLTDDLTDQPVATAGLMEAGVLWANIFFSIKQHIVPSNIF